MITVMVLLLVIAAFAVTNGSRSSGWYFTECQHGNRLIDCQQCRVGRP